MGRELTNQMLILDGREFAIQAMIGRGASCVVYRAVCPDKTEHLLKEYNPRHIAMYRENNGELCLESEEDREAFEAGLVRFREGHAKQRELRLDSDLKNSTSNVQGIYKANGTEYIDMTCFSGKTYDQVQEKSVYDLVRRMKALVQVIGNYHKAGLLHLDIKPENIFALPETCEMVMLFDFDSVVSRESAAAGGARSYTLSWAAPEQTNPLKRNTICEATDIFAVGEMIFCQLIGRQSNGSYRHSTTEERLSFAEYHFDHKLPIFENLNPKAFSMLEDLLHHTICVSIKERYQSTDDLIAKLDEIIAIADPKTPYLKSSLPVVQDFFVGRENEIEEIHRKLSENRILFLTGIGGIGKSELAKHYADNYRAEYDTIIFAPYVSDMNMLLQDDMAIPLYNFSQYPEEKPEEYCARKLRKLQEICDERTLFIVDNLDRDDDPNISKLLDLGCNLLITTRRDFSGFGKPQMYVNKLSNGKKVREIFDKYYEVQDDEESASVDDIIALLDGHTMAVELIAKQIEAEWASPNEILTQLKETGIAGLGDSSVDSGKDGFSSRNMYAHIKALFDLAVFSKNNNEDALYVLVNLALIPHTGIDRKLFAQWCKLNQHGGKTVVNNLIKTGWVRQDFESKTISLHPVISEIVIPILQSNVEATNSLFQSIHSSIANTTADVLNVTQQNICLQLCQRVLQRKIESLYIAKCLSAEYWVENVCGCIENDFKVLHAFYTFSTSVLERSFPDYLNELVEAYGNFATLLYYKNDQNLAEQYSLKAINLIETNMQANRNEVAKLYTTLGCIYSEQSLFEKAEDAHKHALDYGDLMFLPVVYNNLAMVYRDCDRFDDAEKCYFEALTLQKNITGETHKDVSLIYDNLGGMYEELGDYEKAIFYHKKAIDIRIELLGEKNIDTARSFSGIGLAYIRMKCYDLAEIYLTKALEIEIELRGENSEIVAHTYNNLAGMFDESGNTTKAERYYKKALSLFQKYYGENSSYVALVSNNLGAFYAETGRLEDAFDAITYALQIRMSVFGSDHTETAGSLYWLGLAYEKKGNNAEAHNYLSEAYSIYSRNFPSDHIRVQRTKAALTRISAQC